MTSLRALLLSSLCMLPLSMAAHAEEAAKAAPVTAGFSAAQKAELKTLMKDYLLENPEVLIEAVNKYKEKEEQKQMAASQEALGKHKEFLTNNPKAPFIGNPKGSITVVEFFDYNCGYCKKALPELVKLIEKDKDVKVVFKELPILSETSDFAARYALAANLQGKYFDFHKAVMEYGGPKDETSLQDLGKKVGLDVEKLKADAASQEVKDMLAKNQSVAQELGVSGTPGFIIGDQVVRGYMPYDGMVAVIDQTRKAKKS